MSFVEPPSPKVVCHPLCLSEQPYLRFPKPSLAQAPNANGNKLPPSASSLASLLNHLRLPLVKMIPHLDV